MLQAAVREASCSPRLALMINRSVTLMQRAASRLEALTRVERA
jgi:hypothetical protein